MSVAARGWQAASCVLQDPLRVRGFDRRVG